MSGERVLCRGALPFLSNANTPLFHARGSCHPLVGSGHCEHGMFALKILRTNPSTNLLTL